MDLASRAAPALFRSAVEARRSWRAVYDSAADSIVIPLAEVSRLARSGAYVPRQRRLEMALLDGLSILYVELVLGATAKAGD